jgi:hypothetical protein
MLNQCFWTLHLEEIQLIFLYVMKNDITTKIT